MATLVYSYYSASMRKSHIRPHVSVFVAVGYSLSSRKCLQTFPLLTASAVRYFGKKETLFTYM